MIGLRPLSQVLLDYITHPESKSKGDVGTLQRPHLAIQKSSIHYMGKESNELEASNVLGVFDGNYAEYLDIESKILRRKPDQAYKFGISRGNLFTLQKKIKDKIPIKVQNGPLKRLQAIQVLFLWRFLKKKEVI